MGHPHAGRFVWYENLTLDAKAAIAFYTDVMGWKTQAFGDGGYVMWVGSQGPLGGVYTLPEEAAKMGAPPHWIGNVQVDDVDRTAALAKELGGKVLKEPADVPTVGRYAVLGDPFGSVIAAFKPSQEMPLHDMNREGEVSWNELLTTDHLKAFAFYSQLFGWQKLNEMDMGPMGTYLIYGVGETQLGGMMTRPADNPMPPFWFYYVSTNDLDAAIARSTAHGAKVLNGPMDVPGGRVAQLMDSQGAAYALHQAATK